MRRAEALKKSGAGLDLLKSASKKEVTSKPLVAEARSSYSFEFKSTDVLPKVIYRIVHQSPPIWLGYARITALVGLVTVVYSLAAITYLAWALYLPLPFSFPPLSATPVSVLIALLGFAIAYVVHEFSHAVIAVLHGCKIEAIGFSFGGLIGGSVHIAREAIPESPKVMMMFNAAGIGANMLIGCLCYVIGSLFSSAAVLWIGTINSLFAVINALPVVPLDGGWVYSDIVNSVHWRRGKKLLRLIPALFPIIWIVLLSIALF